jgi:hypothetical protein
MLRPPTPEGNLVAAAVCLAILMLIQFCSCSSTKLPDGFKEFSVGNDTGSVFYEGADGSKLVVVDRQQADAFKHGMTAFGAAFGTWVFGQVSQNKSDNETAEVITGTKSAEREVRSLSNDKVRIRKIENETERQRIPPH